LETAAVDRAGRYRRPQLHEDMVKLTDVSAKVRQIAIKNIGRDEPTQMITHDLATPARDLFARYAERMMVENDRPDLKSPRRVGEAVLSDARGGREPQSAACRPAGFRALATG
jgi:hypothetical protein